MNRFIFKIALVCIAALIVTCFASCGTDSDTTATQQAGISADGSKDVSTYTHVHSSRCGCPCPPPPCNTCTKPLPGAAMLSSVSTGGSSVTVTWTASSDAEKYEIWFREQGANTDWQLAGTSTTTSFTVTTGLETCKYYEFKVRAVNCKGNGPWCDTGIGWIGDTDPADCGDCGCDDDEPCGPCKGKVTELTLVYNGTTGGTVTVTGGSKKGGGGSIFSDAVAPGGIFTVAAAAGGTLGTNIYLTIGGVETAIHTSCSQPIGPGSVYGPFTVVSGRSLYGGPLCPSEPPCTDCDPTCKYWRKYVECKAKYGANSTKCEKYRKKCDKKKKGSSGCSGRVNSLTLQYLGTTGGTITASGGSKKGSSGSFFSGDVQPGDIFSFTAPAGQSFGTNTEFTLNGQFLQAIHTSCSQPIGIGMTWGSFLILDGSSLQGGQLPQMPGAIGGQGKK